MTDADKFTPEDEADALAAEYVLGVLDLAERAQVEARIKAEAAFAARVRRWETRLAPLNAGYAEMPPPDLLPRIEARLFPRASRRRFGFGLFAGAALVAAAGLGLFLNQPPAGPTYAATLLAEGQDLAFAARLDAATGELTLIRTAGDAAAAGQDHQLWAIGSDGVPASLGLIRDAEGVRKVPVLLPGVVLAVSLEPLGGSPTGLPTGPVLVTGALVES